MIRVKCVSVQPFLEGEGFVTTGSFINLTSGNVYEARREGKWWRVWDDFGEDYLYPLDRFEPVKEKPVDDLA